MDVMKIVEDRWDQKTRELEQQIMEYTSERDSLNEQYDNAMDQISLLKQESTQLSDDLL